MSEQEKEDRVNPPDESVSWGPKLFYAVFIAVLVFFWWMVIYPHGVTPTN